MRLFPEQPTRYDRRHFAMYLQGRKNILYSKTEFPFVVNMKFLVIQKVKREIPVERWAKLLPLQFKYFDGLEREKTLEVTYHLIGQQGSMCIFNVDSDEKLSRIIGQDPLFFESEREIYPLTTRQTHEKQIRELLKP
jgi:muconolactone delta-isomerase